MHVSQRLKRQLFAAMLAISVAFLGQLIELPRAYAQGFRGKIINPDIEMSIEEEKAYQLASQQRFIEARPEAEAILKSKADSIIAHYVLALVFHEGEGNLLRALPLYRRSIELFKKQYHPEKDKPDSSQLQSWHVRLLSDLARLYAELDHRESEVKQYQYIADIYEQPINLAATWAFIKLGDYETAKALIQRGKLSEENSTVLSAYNSELAFYDAQFKHEIAYQKGLEAIQRARGDSCVILMNHSRSEAIFLEWSSAMRHLSEAAQARSQDCPTSPWLGMVNMYLVEGSYQKAISTMRKVRSLPLEKRMVIQTEKRIRTELVGIFYSMGFSDKAYPLMKTVIEAPDRLGYDSLAQEQVRLSHLLIYLAVTEDALEQVQEKIEAEGLLNRLWFVDKEARERLSKLRDLRNEYLRYLWSARQQAMHVAMNSKSLTGLLVPFYLDSPIYYYASVDQLGRRSVLQILEKERSRISEREAQAFQAVWSLFEAYIAWRSGEAEQAKALAELAYQSLDEHYSLLRMQAQLILGDLAKQAGKAEEAYRHFVSVYTRYPALFRHFKVPLPVRLSATEDVEARKLGLAVIGSRRFEVTEDAPYEITVHRQEEGHYSLCLNAAQGMRQSCTSLDSELEALSGRPEEERVELFGRFLQEAFSPRVSLAQEDIHSLDGSPLRISAREALDQLFHAGERKPKQDPVAP